MAHATLDAIALTTFSSVSSITRSLTLTAGSASRLLVVRLGLNTTHSVSGITFAGTAFSNGNAALVTATNSGSNVRSEIWYLLNPTTGSPQNLVITFAGAGSTGVYAVDHIDDVHQTTPWRASTISGGSTVGTDVSFTSGNITGAVSGDWLLDCAVTAGNRSASLAPVAPQTGSVLNVSTTLTTGISVITAPTDPDNVGWTWSVGATWCVTGALLVPTSGAAAPTFRRTLGARVGSRS